MKTLQKKIVLASQSPRRKQLLEQAGFSFEIRTNPIDETFPSDLPAQEVAPYLARNKAKAAMGLLKHPEEILLTADSVVILNGKIYNKPENRQDAIRILSDLSGQTHTVITGVCLCNQEKEKVFSGVSHVTMNPLSTEEIEFYIDQYQPFDKAGAYAIQEWIGLCKIAKIEGTYANIMGLPVDLVYAELANF